MIKTLEGLFSLSSLIAFILGIATVEVWGRFKARYMGAKVRKFNSLWIAGALVTAAILFVAVKTQTTADQAAKAQQLAVQVATQAQDCQRQFNQAILARDAVTVENESLATTERDALQQFITTLLSPPADIAGLAPDDPARQQWAIGVTQTYLDTVNGARTQRAANDAKRAANPLPQPTCGR